MIATMYAEWIGQNEYHFWQCVSKNPAAIDLLKANLSKINWWYLSENPAAIELLKANPDKIYWANLCYNPAAIDLLKENPDKTSWCMTDDQARNEMINPSKIDWEHLSASPAAIDIIEEAIQIMAEKGFSSQTIVSTIG